MNTSIVRAIHLPLHSAQGWLPLPLRMVWLVSLLCVAFAVIWIATVAEALHPYGAPLPSPQRVRATVNGSVTDGHTGVHHNHGEQR